MFFLFLNLLPSVFGKKKLTKAPVYFRDCCLAGDVASTINLFTTVINTSV